MKIYPSDPNDMNGRNANLLAIVISDCVHDAE